MVPSSLSEPALHRLRFAFQQKSLYDEMRKGMASNFNAVKVEREDGTVEVAEREARASRGAGG